MAYTGINDPSAYFQTKLYTGTNNELVLTFDGNSDLQTDMIWTKNRGRASVNHVLSDTVRGIAKGLYPDLSNVQGDTNYISAIGSNGYTIVATDSVEMNRDDDTFVSWNWKTGTAFSNDASSTSVGSIDSVGSVNTDAGFSIMSYTGTGSAGTLAHGLSAVPAWYIVKGVSKNDGWFVYHHKNTAAPQTDFLRLDVADATTDQANIFNDTAPTSTVFSIGTDNGVNESGETYIAYIFAEKQGYSKFTSYTGNANADGPFVYTGFKPAFFIYKNTNTSGEEWKILDNKRDPFNRASQRNLNVHVNTAESDDTNSIGEFVSNGVKIRSAHNNINKSGSPFIFMAFAENPFVTSTGVPTTAR